MWRTSSTFLAFDYVRLDIFRSFNSGSIDMQTESVPSAVWQLAAFKDNLSKYFPSEFV